MRSLLKSVSFPSFKEYLHCQDTSLQAGRATFFVFKHVVGVYQVTNAMMKGLFPVVNS